MFISPCSTCFKSMSVESNLKPSLVLTFNAVVIVSSYMPIYSIIKRPRPIKMPCQLVETSNDPPIGQKTEQNQTVNDFVLLYNTVNRNLQIEF